MEKFTAFDVFDAVFEQQLCARPGEPIPNDPTDIYEHVKQSAKEQFSVNLPRPVVSQIVAAFYRYATLRRKHRKIAFNDFKREIIEPLFAIDLDTHLADHD